MRGVKRPRPTLVELLLLYARLYRSTEIRKIEECMLVVVKMIEGGIETEIEV